MPFSQSWTRSALVLLASLSLTACVEKHKPSPTPKPQAPKNVNAAKATKAAGPTKANKARKVRVLSMTPVPNPKHRLPPVRLSNKLRKLMQPVRRAPASTTATPNSGPLFSKAPVSRQPSLPKIDPKTVFYPIPFDLHLNATEKRYQAKFAEAGKLKVGVREKLFLSQLKKERKYEGLRRSYQTQMVRLAGIRYLRLKGLKRYQLMGYLSLRTMEKRLQEYLAAGGSPLSVPKGKEKFAKEAQRLVEHLGFYPLLLKQIGLKIGAKSLSRTQRFWLRTLFLARWARQVWGVYPLPAMMGNANYVDYQKARILWTKGFRKRLFSLRECQRLDHRFPLYRVLGWLFLQEGRVGAARASFRDAVRKNPKDKLSQSLLDKISRPPT